jgi:hypothetical protein
MSVEDLKNIIDDLIRLDSFSGNASMTEIENDDVDYREVEKALIELKPLPGLVTIRDDFKRVLGLMFSSNILDKKNEYIRTLIYYATHFYKTYYKENLEYFYKRLDRPRGAGRMSYRSRKMKKHKKSKSYKKIRKGKRSKRRRY